MTPRVRTRPPFALPSIQPHNLRAFIQGDHTVDFSIRVGMVLPLEIFLVV